MTIGAKHEKTAGTLKPCPVELVCPCCHGQLNEEIDTIECLDCNQSFEIKLGFRDLVIGGRFDDPTGESLMLYEEKSNEDLTKNYWLPLFAKIWPDSTSSKRLLSVGCGTGVDIDLLTDDGYNSIGIDNGNRTNVWPRRSYHERLVMANGLHLPFDDESFDAVYCGCVFPHVGVIGDSFIVSDTYHEDRLDLAREMTRVLKPKGRIIVSSPNRYFPFDIFHGRDEGSYKVRATKPSDPFLLSIGDYKKLFFKAGCNYSDSLPVDNYWGFIRSKHNFPGYLFGLPVRFVFWLVSKPVFKFLRGSPINPWIVVILGKDAS